VLRKVFRGKFTDGLEQLWREKRLYLPGPLKVLRWEKTFRTFLRSLHRKKWVVYVKPPFGGPQHVLQFLARYTHRVAISNHRITNFAEGKVSFRWKDYAHGSQQRVMTLEANEFLRRFLQHILPLRFVRIRSFGFLTHRQRTVSLALCRELLATAEVPAPVVAKACEAAWPCPHCGGPMVVIERLTAQQLAREVVLDSS
jgi:hypothetical protein